MAAANTSRRALEGELRDLMRRPVEGFAVELKDDNIFEWAISMFGPPDSLYEGGYFKLKMNFPRDYPYSPPSLIFQTKMFHPNIYHDGKVCISILHDPGADAMSGELPSERWNPTQNVRTILLSVVSLLTEPNDSSPANVDAGVQFRAWKMNNCTQYPDTVKELVAATAAVAKADNVVVPRTLDDYCQASKQQAKLDTMNIDEILDNDLYDDEGDLEYEEYDEDYEEDCKECDEEEDDEQKGELREDNDSGTGV